MARVWSQATPFSWTLFFLTMVYLTHCTRGQREHFVVDTLVVMDTPAYVRWLGRESTDLPLEARQNAAKEKMKQYASLVIRQTNVRLESLTDSTNDWTIRLSVAEISIGKDPLAGSVDQASKTISVELAISTMKVWTSTQGYNNLYDYVVLLTGYNILGDANLPYDIKGVANVGSLCQTDGTSVTVVEDRGGFQSPHFVAHEVGHSLGSKHDGETPNEACPDGERYLMAIYNSEVTSSNLVHPWYFSSCSKKVIGQHVQNTILQQFAPCLREAKQPVLEFTATEGVLAGQVYKHNEQCQHLNGPGSRLCLGSNFGSLSDVCTSMHCLDTSLESGGFRCLEYRAAEGTSCADGKICLKGECTESPLAPKGTHFADDDCLFGDTPLKIDGRYSCSVYTRLSPASCYTPSIRAGCCGSCAEIERPYKACPFGDRESGCSAGVCQHIDPDGTRFEEVCCETCGYDVIKDCVDASSIDGMTCTERVNLNGLQACYNTSVAYHCCKTCQGLRTARKGCEYGDYTVDQSCRGLAYDKESCQTHGGQCCHTCHNLNVDRSDAQTVKGSLPICILVSFLVPFILL